MGENDCLNTERLAFLMRTSRLPRLAALALTGAGLSIGGVILQQIVRNKFVEPATTGGLDAAKLGLLVALTLVPGLGLAGSAGFAFLFAFAAGLVYVAIIARMRLPSTLLVPVIGLMYGGVLSGIAEFFAYRTNTMQTMQGWMLGDFSKIVEGNYEILYITVPAVSAAYLFARRFTVVGLGPGIAESLGLNYAATVAFGLALVAVTASVTVIAVGAVPFVGLIIPNLIALRHGDNLVRTLPLVALAGANFLIACDIFGRLVIYPFEVPIALTTGAVGGVTFLALIARRNR